MRQFQFAAWSEEGKMCRAVDHMDFGSPAQFLFDDRGIRRGRNRVVAIADPDLHGDPHIAESATFESES